MSKNILGKRIQQIRKAKGLTQFKLAEIAGINEKHVSKIETGVYFPTYSTLNKILNALGMTVEDVGLGINQEQKNSFYTMSLEILYIA
ncbi:MAG: helix-turn-helix transcriptional regulator [bacterium]|nr:helix-turn-helix transcriptional regulator [bacterium]